MSVEDLLAEPLHQLLRPRGVGNKTQREISAAVKMLRDRLGKPACSDLAPIEHHVEEQVEADTEVAATVDRCRYQQAIRLMRWLSPSSGRRIAGSALRVA